jgi:hypothetical protein
MFQTRNLVFLLLVVLVEGIFYIFIFIFITLPSSPLSLFIVSKAEGSPNLVVQ